METNRLDYRRLIVDKELGITDIRQLAIGNMVAFKFKDKFYLAVVDKLTPYRCHITGLKINPWGSGVEFGAEDIHKKIFPLSITNEFLQELGFVLEKDETRLTDDVIESELIYRHPDNVYTITATKYNNNVVVSDGYRIHVDNCDMDTVCAVGEMKHWHSLQNFLTSNGIQLFDYVFEKTK